MKGLGKVSKFGGFHIDRVDEHIISRAVLPTGLRYLRFSPLLKGRLGGLLRMPAAVKVTWGRWTEGCCDRIELADQ